MNHNLTQESLPLTHQLPLAEFSLYPNPQLLPPLNHQLPTKIKALTIWQPYPELIKARIKIYETRSWYTHYRGQLLICSALKKTRPQAQLYLNLISNHNLTLKPYHQLPFGQAICLCELVDCLPITPHLIQQQPQLELDCGNWTIGHYAWLLDHIQPLNPFPIKGQQKLFTVSLNPPQPCYCPSCEQPLLNLDDGCGVCGWISPKKKIVQEYKHSSFLGEINESSADDQSPKKKIVQNYKHKKSDKLLKISPKKNPSGHLSPTTQRKKDKSGRLVEYPKVEGERVPLDLAWEYPHQFFWIYNWSVKDSQGHWKNKSKSVPRSRLWTVRNAIASNKPVEEILKLIQKP